MPRVQGDWSPERMMEVGERIWNMEREYNTKAGFTAADDTLPTRLTTLPANVGPAAGRVSQVEKNVAGVLRRSRLEYRWHSHCRNASTTRTAWITNAPRNYWRGPGSSFCCRALEETRRTKRSYTVGGRRCAAVLAHGDSLLSGGNITPEGTYLRKDAAHFDKLGINVRHARASAINPQSKEVLLGAEGSIKYDKLLVATGATATKPPIPGIDLDNVHNCWSLADAHKIIDKASPGSNVILMGAGFIGCIILESLAARKVNLTVIEMENRMVSRMTNRVMGTMIKDWCVDQGIRVLTSTKVDRIDAKGEALTVSTNTGESIDADLVICATGVRSNTAFLDGSGITVEMGVVVDDYMQTSVADIYAAGDVAQGKDFSTGEYYVQAIQPTAVEHGKVAAQSMVSGHVTKHAGNVNMNVLDTVGLISTSFGMWMGVDGGEESELVDKDNYQYINLQFKDDVLVGASTLGMTQHVGVMRGPNSDRFTIG